MSDESMQIGRYVVLEELGSGGFSTVFRAQDTILKREVALKVMRPVLLSDPRFVARFKREAQVMAGLNHPHIMPIYDYGEFENRLCLVMKLMPGRSVAHLVEGGPLPWERVMAITQQVASALDYAHDRGLVHRDVKPHNVLLDEEGRTALADFGLVRALEAGTITSSLSGGILGTPAYVAPEIWNAETATAATDVYALACVVFNMATGATLFDAPTPPATLALHFQPPQFPEEWPEGVPPGLERTLIKALARGPGDRYESAGAFAADLLALEADPLAGPYVALEEALTAGRWSDAAALAEEVISRDPGYRDARAMLARALEGSAAAERESWAAQWREAAEAALSAGKWKQALLAARKWQEFAPEEEAAAVAVARAEEGLVAERDAGDLITGVASSSRAGLPTPDRPNAADARAEDRSKGDAGRGTLSPPTSASARLQMETISRAPIASETRRKIPRRVLVVGAALGIMLTIVLIAFDASDIRKRFATIYLLAAGRVESLEPIADLYGGSPRFSPDGRLLVTQARGMPYLYDGENGESVASLEVENVGGMVFSADGTRIVFGDLFTPTLELWDLEKGVILARLQGHTDNVNTADFSRDGTRIVTASSDGTARLWNGEGDGLLAVLEGHSEPLRSASFSPDGTRIATASDDHTARLWDGETGDAIAILEGHSESVRSAVFSPDGRVVVTRSWDGTARLWDAESGTAIAVLDQHTVESVAVSPDSKQVVTASHDGTARLWDIDGRQIAVLEGHTSLVTGATFSPDGERVITVSSDETARLWGKDGELIAVLEGHTESVDSATFSPDGTLVATGSLDGTGRVWATESGVLIAVLPGRNVDTGWVGRVSFSPDGMRLVSHNGSRAAALWTTPSN